MGGVCVPMSACLVSGGMRVYAVVCGRGRGLRRAAVALMAVCCAWWCGCPGCCVVMLVCGRACGRVCACAHTCACAYPRVYARRRVRMGACAYMRGYGTVSGGGMRLSDVGSCLVIVAWCNCCMCNYMGMGVVAWALWFDGFCGGYGGFDTPRNASGCNGFSGGLRY